MTVASAALAAGVIFPPNALATTYVLNTGTTALSAEYLAAVTAMNDGVAPTVVQAGGTTNFINGVSVHLGAIADGSRTTNVAGDLNLGSTDRVYAAGPNTLTLRVANNANIASGAVLSARAIGKFAGAAAATAAG